MTVREVIMHSALMRLPRTMKLKEKESIVDLIIEVLGIYHGISVIIHN